MRSIRDDHNFVPTARYGLRPMAEFPAAEVPIGGRPVPEALGGYRPQLAI